MLADFDYSSHKETICADLGNSYFADNCLSENRHSAYFGRYFAVKMLWIAVGAVFLSALGGYLYGKSQAKVQIVEHEVEVIRYAAQKRAKIQAEPNASRTELIELMRKGEL